MSTMHYHAFNIGKPNTESWWARNRGLNVITAGFENRPGDRGHRILHDMDEGDWVLAYSIGHGFIGAGIVGSRETYRLLKPSDLPAGYESPTHRHLRTVTWIRFVDSLDHAVSPAEARHRHPRQTKERIHDHAAAKRIISLIAARSPLVEEHLPEEIPVDACYDEGAVKQVLVDRCERSPEARRDCVAHWGSCCFVCNFDFAQKYGALGAGYIHVHHLRLISAEKKAHKVSPVTDLRPVCPNCHAMLHRRSPPLSIEALQHQLCNNQ
jgi:hypothetical protein